MFRKNRGIKRSSPTPSFACVSSLTYDAQPKTVKNKINKLCDEIGGEFRDALFEFVTTEKTVTEISLKHYVSETKLYNMRKKFYESWRM